MTNPTPPKATAHYKLVDHPVATQLGIGFGNVDSAQREIGFEATKTPTVAPVYSSFIRRFSGSLLRPCWKTSIGGKNPSANGKGPSILVIQNRIPSLRSRARSSGVNETSSSTSTRRLYRTSIYQSYVCRCANQERGPRKYLVRDRNKFCKSAWNALAIFEK